jgi:hypothetical protein
MTEPQSKALTAAERAGWSFDPMRTLRDGALAGFATHVKHGLACWVIGVNGLVTRRPA